MDIYDDIDLERCEDCGEDIIAGSDCWACELDRQQGSEVQQKASSAIDNMLMHLPRLRLMYPGNFNGIGWNAYHEFEIAMQRLIADKKKDIDGK